MTKKQIRLNENELKSLIRESVINFLNENMDKLSDRENDIMRGYWSSVDDMRMPKQKYPFDEKPKKSKWELGSVNEMDELTPGFAIHAAHAAAEDKKKHPGRGKNSSDPALRAKRDAQIKKFGDYAADAMNSEMDDPDFMVIGDRGARRMMYANGDNSAYLTNDIEDLDATRLYNDNYQEGDEPLTIGSLPDDERARVHDRFDKFKTHHKNAQELDDKYLEETVKKAVSKVLNEIGDTERGQYMIGRAAGRRIANGANLSRNADNNGTNPFYAKASVAMRQKGSDENLKGNEIYAYGNRQANNSKDLDDFSKKSNALNKGFNDELKKYK